MKKTPHIININDWYRMVSMEKSCYFGYLLGLNISASGVSQSLETAKFEGLPAAGATPLWRIFVCKECMHHLQFKIIVQFKHHLQMLTLSNTLYMYIRIHIYNIYTAYTCSFKPGMVQICNFMQFCHLHKCSTEICVHVPMCQMPNSNQKCFQQKD